MQYHSLLQSLLSWSSFTVEAWLIKENAGVRHGRCRSYDARVGEKHRGRLVLGIVIVSFEYVRVVALNMTSVGQVHFFELLKIDNHNTHTNWFMLPSQTTVE